MNIIAETSRISIKMLEESDLELIHKWWNDGRVTKHMGFPNGMKVTKEKLHHRFKEQIEEKNKILNTRIYIIYSKEMKKPIGELQYGEADMDKKKCRLGIKIGELDAQGKGNGKEALICFIQYLFNKLKMQLIEIDSFPENERAYNLYMRIGFKEVEILKKFWTDETNKIHDLVMMELKKGDWKFSEVKIKY
ncbi:GNAT family N-acetyltransferase [Sedimentibacter sp. zth1]|uniref:GNAT family N-acetyltransferase n=1 Tax=Sedimentibacter sp. zth1 TaxID=2816908 RepID=UPI001A9153D7|nr:GNAT family protein [Sedimentibacter sp. zth1]QSX07233.1 GNAT family N-acetyltransferase [Sedimentibacter sp. zth1]